MSSPPQETDLDAQAAPELQTELDAFRQQWQAEARTRQRLTTTSSARPVEAEPFAESNERGKGKEREQQEREDDLDPDFVRDLWTLRLKEQAPRPKSALEHYTEAVEYEKEGRLSDALVGYRSAFRLDPEVDRAYHQAFLAGENKHASRGAEPHSTSSFSAPPAPPSAEFKFERTIQLAPDYDAKKEHRSMEEVERESGSGDKDSTHPSSTAFLLNSLLKSFGENPYERPAPAITTAAPRPTSPSTSPSTNAVPLPPITSPSAPSKPSLPVLSPDEVLASLSFVPADEELPLFLSILPREVLILILQHLLLSGILPPPKPTHVEPEQQPFRGRRAQKKRTLKEEMVFLEGDLELDPIGEWKHDVEALERFALTCRAARVLTLDSALWRSLCHRVYVAPHQISRDEKAAELVRQHGSDWRRFFIEHPRLRYDGVHISVVTYLRRGETESRYAPTHLVTFYRYLRFYDNGLVLSLLTTDPPNTVVRRLNPTLRMKGLMIGRWRLRGETVDLWGLEDPNVEEQLRKYSFRMSLRLRSSARGRMNKLEMQTLATEHRQTLELEPVSIRPTKPFFFSKVAAYAGEDRE